jgi:hypothetical protein
VADVWILVDELSEALDSTSTLSVMVAALKDAIATHPSTPTLDAVQVIAAADLATVGPHAIALPLTLNLPATLEFPAAAVYRTCRDVAQLRQQVADQFGTATGDGQYWLPIVLTAKGPLYAEAIAPQPGSAPIDSRFLQPLHLSDRQRQPLYQLGMQLLTLLQAPPAVYLLQFGLQGDRVWFDRLLPFPAEAAIASLGIQTPNLYTCHWQCVKGQPIFDLIIPGMMIQTISPAPRNLL